MKRTAILIYGAACYAMFLGVFLYAVGFIGNFGVPKTIDGEPYTPLWMAALVNAALLAVFAAQHSLMARPFFKRWWTQYVPKPAERSTYVLFTNLALMLLFWQWQPMGGSVWSVENPTARMALHAVCVAGWGLVLYATFLINHFDLFGLRQVWLYWRGKPYTSLRFVTPGPYKVVRHPLYVGWMMAFWGTPGMTAAHFLFAAMATAYILMAIRWEERDLMAFHGGEYARYRAQTPMLIPRMRADKPEPVAGAGADA